MRGKPTKAKTAPEAPAEKKASLPRSTSWLLRVLVLVGLAGSVYIIYALRHHALSDQRLSFGKEISADEVRGTSATVSLRGKAPIQFRDNKALGVTIGNNQGKPERPVNSVKSLSAPPSAALTLKIKNVLPSEDPKEGGDVPEIESKSSKSLYEHVDYSGLYRAEGEHESYAGAWLAPLKRLVSSYPQLNRTTNLEGSTMAVSGYGRRQDPRITVMTRDFFDFQVLHLSVTTNFIDSISRGGGPSAFTKQLFDRVHDQMVRTVQQLEMPLDKMQGHGDPRLAQQTVALIPFTGFAASTDKNEYQANIRKLYFKATFFSVYRYIRTVVVTVPTQNDYDVLVGMKLPVWKILNFKARYNLKVNTEHPLSTVRLPKHSIMYVIDKMRSSAAYSKFKYVYYTEGDLVLHMRSEKELLDAIDRSHGEFAAAPHRMQSNPLPKAYSKDLQSLWSYSAPHRFHLQRFVAYSSPLPSPVVNY